MGCGVLAARNIHHRVIENRREIWLLGAIDCPPTNHEVGSSNLSGRAIKSSTYDSAAPLMHP